MKEDEINSAAKAMEFAEQVFPEST